MAVLEDIVLWLALAIATALAGSTVLNSRELALHLGTTIGFFGLALTVVPRIIKRLNKSRFNVFAHSLQLDTQSRCFSLIAWSLAP